MTPTVAESRLAQRTRRAMDCACRLAMAGQVLAECLRQAGADESHARVIRRADVKAAQGKAMLLRRDLILACAALEEEMPGGGAVILEGAARLYEMAMSIGENLADLMPFIPADAACAVESEAA
jgi:hypothetical protein